MKKISMIVLCLMLCISLLAACGGNGSTTTGSGADQIWTIVHATDETRYSPNSRATLYFGQLLYERSGGRLILDAFFDAALGNEREITEAVDAGLMDMGVVTSGFLAPFSSDWYVLDLPYVFLTREDMYRAYDGALGAYLKDSIRAASNIEVLAFLDGGFRALLTSAPVATLEDLRRLRIRVVPNEMNLALYNAWGSAAVPVPFGETYMALQLGTVDGADTSVFFHRDALFYEVTEYMTQTNHAAFNLCVIINQDFLNNLPADLQEILLQAAHDAYNVQQRIYVSSLEGDAFAEVFTGVTDVPLTNAAKQDFIDASRPVLDIYRDQISPALFEILGL